MEKNGKAMAEKMSDFVNSFIPDIEGFIQEMNSDHRTLQQSFTRLCLAWIENCASENYRFDGRNEASHKICKDLIDGFKPSHDNYNPSEFLPFI